MKIELWYDVVLHETDVLVNGLPVEKNDIYGFLYLLNWQKKIKSLFMEQ